MYEETIDLSHVPPEGIKLQRRINLNAWRIREEDWESRTELVFEIFIQSGPRKTLVQGSFAAGILARCHRCLEDMELDLMRNFHLTYLPPDPERFSREEVELTNHELEVAYLEKAFLPLHEMLQEQIYLALPMKFLCRSQCKGLCPHCGVNLNDGECSCPSEQIDPRWASLKRIVYKNRS